MEPEEPIPPVPPFLAKEAAAQPQDIPAQPLPPDPELLRPGVPYAPMTPMMDFLQRRLEALEKDLLVERERARASQSALEQQQTLRTEVEGHLKAMGEQLRREKTERESEETKSHARGRIDALEKRLDEMHQSFVSLLKDAIAQRDSAAQSVTASQSALSFSQTDLAKEQAVLAQEQAQTRQQIAALGGTLRELLDQIGHWRAEARGITELAPELRGLAKQVPEGGRRLEDQLTQRLADFSAQLRESMAEWQHRQQLQAEKQDERALQLAREKAALQRAWEEQNHAVRDEFVRESLRREAEIGQSIQELHRRLDALLSEKSGANSQAAALNERLERLLERMTQSAPARDQVLQSLESERDDLLKSLREKTAALKRYRDERLEIERSLGDSAASLHQELDGEREKNRVLALRVSELEAQAASWNDKIESAKRVAHDQEERSAMLMAEREQLAKAWTAEMEKAKTQLEERTRAEAQWAEKVDSVLKKLAEETQRRADQDSALAALRSQSATLAEQMARSISERDAVVEKFSSWENDRQKLLKIIREKDEMISMLNSTFQNVLKKDQK